MTVSLLILAPSCCDKSLKDIWDHVPPNWSGADPCGDGWSGISCINNRVVSITLASINLSGQLSSDIAKLAELQTCRFSILLSKFLFLHGASCPVFAKDLSYNEGMTGPLPPAIGNLAKLTSLFLANNMLTGPLPNLTGMNSLNYVDLSNNSFDATDIPPWFSSLQSLTSLIMENTQIQGQLPVTLFSLSQLQTVALKNNRINGTLTIGSSHSNQLQLIDLQNNSIEGFTLQADYSVQIILVDNPICNGGSTQSFCSIPQQSNSSYSTPAENCMPLSCTLNKISSPSCKCAYPYTGTLFFRAPSFSNYKNPSIFASLEQALMLTFRSHSVPVDSVSLSNPTKNLDDYLSVTLQIFPSGQDYFNHTGISEVGFMLSNQTFKPPPEFGPFFFIGNSYPYFSGFYAFRQKKRAETAAKKSDPFASWDPNTNSGGVPQLKGAKCFSFEELKRSTNNFSETNEIGSGGYGKVYRGILSNGQLVAIKRAQQGSMQGGLEFKTEIELLTRVHHKNVVSLVGFCFEHGEQMLVYEYIANGTLKDSLSADFGLSKPLGESERGHVTTQVKGTMGYLDPEYYMTQQLTEKSDVYSFGILLLELLTSRSPIEKGKYIVREVKQAMDVTKDMYNLQAILDPIVASGMSSRSIEKFVDLSLRCVQESGVNRPTMSEVVKEIESSMEMAGLNPNAESASTSATYEEESKGLNHPYSNESMFAYSGGYLPPKLEPK
ncbi:UNVERIFIED_CONTAM: putative leucine-rich repeat receptor-like protein kinase [Sesamum latifolium]|uniref:Leucine-rich repeat receptor-like protein kinase n=1 Tax=Sesamum latifolium TaxID=2727402 RepID=A0AAW2UYQ9_9LAMI